MEAKNQVKATPSLAQHVCETQTTEKPTVKYGPRPLSETVKVPWAATLAAQHEKLANSSQDGAVALELCRQGEHSTELRQ